MHRVAGMYTGVKYRVVYRGWGHQLGAIACGLTSRAVPLRPWLVAVGAADGRGWGGRRRGRTGAETAVGMNNRDGWRVLDWRRRVAGAGRGGAAGAGAGAEVGAGAESGLRTEEQAG